MWHSSAKGHIRNKSRLNEKKENTGIGFNEPAKKNAIWHTMPNNSSKLQQQQQDSNTEEQQQKYVAGIYKCIPVRRTAAYSIIIIYQIQVLWVVKSHTVPNKKIRKKRYTTLEKKQKRKHSGHRTLDFLLWGSASYLLTTRFLAWNISEYHLSIRTNEHIGYFGPKTKTAPPVGRRGKHGRGRPRKRDEQGEAHRAEPTPNGGPHLELGRLRLKTWSISDFSVAERT